MDGLDQFAETLGRLDSEGMSLPPQEATRVILTGARERGWPFDQAWSVAMNRLQASSSGFATDAGADDDLRRRIKTATSDERSALVAERRALWVDPAADSEMRETRAILEECRPHFRAAYEGTSLTTSDLAGETVAAWDRLGGPVPLHYRDQAPGGDQGNGHRRNGDGVVAAGRGDQRPGQGGEVDQQQDHGGHQAAAR